MEGRLLGALHFRRQAEIGKSFAGGLHCVAVLARYLGEGGGWWAYTPYRANWRECTVPEPRVGTQGRGLTNMAIPLLSCGNVFPSSVTRCECGAAAQAPLPVLRTLPPVALPADGNGVRIRVLVVEDDESVREVSARHLQLAGYKVDTASDGEAGWAALRRDVFHLLITDNCMPRLSGLELIVRLRAAGMALPVILASGTLPLSEATVPLALQPVTTLGKPFCVGELLARVRTYLRDLTVPHCAAPEVAIHG